MKPAALLLGVALLGLLQGCDPGVELDDSDYLARAEERLQADDYAGAVVELKNALQANPDNPQVRWTLGQLYAEKGEWGLAEKELRYARELGVLPDSVYPLLARIFVLQKKYKEVLTVDPAAVASRPGQAQIYASHALGWLDAGKDQEVDKALRKAYTLAPEEPYVRIVAAQIALLRKDPTTAISLISAVNSTEPAYVPAWVFMGNLAQRQGDFERAAEAYSKAVEHQPWNRNALYHRAVARVYSGDLEGAEADLEQLEAEARNAPPVRLVRGLLALFGKDYAAAVVDLNAAVDGGIETARSFYYAGVANLRVGNRERAATFLEAALARDPGIGTARLLLAQLLIHRKKYTEAEAVLRPAAGMERGGVRHKRLLAAALIGQNRIEEALPLLEQASSLSEEAPTEQLALAMGLLLAGDEEAGVARLQTAIAAADGNAAADEYLVRFLLHQGRLDTALERAQDYRARFPEASGPYAILGLVRLQRGETKEASVAFRRALELEPGEPTAGLELGAMLQAEGKTAQAEDLYRSVLDHNPDHLGAMMAMAGLQARRGDAAGFEDWMRRAAAAHPDTAAPRVLLAEYFNLRGEAQRALEVLDPAAKKFQDDPRYQAAAGTASLQLGKLEEAKASFQRLVALRPDSARAHRLLSRALLRLQGWPEARAALERVLELEPDAIPSRIELVRLLLIEGQPAAARHVLAPLQEAAPEDPEVTLLAGMIAAAADEPDEARRLLGRAMAQRPAREAALALAQQEIEEGQDERALEILRDWVGANPGDLGARLALADVFLSAGARVDALGQYEAVLREDPENLAALNNLAWYLKDADPARALDYAKKAVELHPRSHQALDTLAALHMDAGKLKPAREALERALTRAPDEKALLVRYAVLLSRLREYQAAIDALEKALGSGEPFPQRSEAQALRERLEVVLRGGAAVKARSESGG